MYTLIRNIWSWFEDKPKPIPALFSCPECKLKHIDKGIWKIKPHKSHLCEKCGHIWKPFDQTSVGCEWL